MATAYLIETELTTITVYVDNDGMPRFARVSALDNLPLGVVQRQYPAPEGSAWQLETPFEAIVVTFGNPN